MELLWRYGQQEEEQEGEQEEQQQASQMLWSGFLSGASAEGEGGER